jgi:hypothetical protein
MAKQPASQEQQDDDAKAAELQEQQDQVQAQAKQAAERKAAAPPMTTQVVVGPGRSVMHEVQIGTKIVDGKEVPVMAAKISGPGELIDLPHHDAAHVRSQGFTQERPAEPPPVPDRQEAEEARTTINGDDGRTIRGR